MDDVNVLRAMGGLWGGATVSGSDVFVTHPSETIREDIWRLSQNNCNNREKDGDNLIFNEVNTNSYLWLGANKKLVYWMVKVIEDFEAQAFLDALYIPGKHIEWTSIQEKQIEEMTYVSENIEYSENYSQNNNPGKNLVYP